jgi:hypothetical protein
MDRAGHGGFTHSHTLIRTREREPVLFGTRKANDAFFIKKPGKLVKPACFLKARMRKKGGGGRVGEPRRKTYTYN